jgi:tetratricopeptide (TPR) repeat protein
MGIDIMKLRIRTYCLPLILLVLISFGCSQSPEDQAVSGLIEKASGLVGESSALREVDPGEADRLEEEALNFLEDAVLNYPSSSIATELAEGEILIGAYTLSELQELVDARVEIEKAATAEIEAIEMDPLARAVELVGEPGPPYLKALVLSHLAEKYREAEDPERVSELMAEALSAASEIEKDYFKSRALIVVSDQYEQAGEDSLASGILDDALKLANGIKYPYFQSGALAEIAGQYIGSGKYKEALPIIEQIKDPYFRAGRLIEAFTAIHNSDNPDEAIGFLLQAEALLEEIDSPHFRAKILARIASGYDSAGKGEEASGLLVSAYELTDTIKDPIPRVEALIEVGKGYRTVGEGERAIEIFARANEDASAIENNLFKDQVLQKIAEEYIEMGEYDRAVGIEDMIDDARSKALVLASLAESYDSMGNTEESRIYVNQSMKASDNIKNPLFRASALIRISDLYHPPVPATVEVLEEEQVPPSEF